MVRQHLIFFHIITAVTIFLSAEYILSRGFHIELGPQHGVGIEVLIVIISAAIPFFITASLLWREIWRLVNLTQIASPRATKPILRLIREELHELEDKLNRLKYYGLELETAGVPDWVQTRCWATMNGRYIGTSRHLPSDYMDILREYLNDHALYLQRRYDDKRKERDSIRIVFHEREVLKQDWQKHREKYDEFVNWHKDNHVELKLLPWERAKELSEKAGLPRDETTQATDMGCWEGELILLWRYGPDATEGPVWLQMGYVGEDLYERCQSFLGAVLKAVEEEDKKAERASFPEEFPAEEFPETPRHHGLTQTATRLIEMMYQAVMRKDS